MRVGDLQQHKQSDVGVSNKSAAMQCEDVAGFNLTLSMLFCFSVPSISLFTF